MTSSTITLTIDEEFCAQYLANGNWSNPVEVIGLTGDTIVIDSSIASWFTTTESIDCPLNVFSMVISSGNATNIILDATTGQISV